MPGRDEWVADNFAAANSDRGIDKMEYEKWTGDRIATLGYMVGAGRSPESIAQEMATTAGNVYRQAARFGLTFRSQPSLTMSPHTYQVMKAAANRRGIDTADLVNRVLRLLGADPTLLENVIDDDFSHKWFGGMQ